MPAVPAQAVPLRALRGRTGALAKELEVRPLSTMIGAPRNVLAILVDRKKAVNYAHQATQATEVQDRGRWEYEKRTRRCSSARRDHVPPTAVLEHRTRWIPILVGEG